MSVPSSISSDLSSWMMLPILIMIPVDQEREYGRTVTNDPSHPRLGITDRPSLLRPVRHVGSLQSG